MPFKMHINLPSLSLSVLPNAEQGDRFGFYYKISTIFKMRSNP